MKTGIISSAVFCLFIAAVCSGARAAERTDFRVNDDAGTATQTSPRIAIAGDQGFAVVWVDRRLGNNDIYLQRFDSSGFAVGKNAIVNDDGTSSYQSEPSIAADLFGKYASVWRDYRNGAYPFYPDIYLQRFDSVLAMEGANTNLTVGASEPLKESPDVAIGMTGYGLVVWADYRNQDWDIYGQRFSSDGSLTGGAFRVNDDAIGNQQHSPRVAVSAEGWYVVTWYDNRSGNDDIFFQRIDSSGTPLGINVKANSDSQDKRQAFPSVAVDQQGQIAVTWLDWRNGSYPLNPGIFVRMFDSIMTPLGAEIKVNDEVSLATLRKPALATDRVGYMMVVWSDSASSLWDITGQIITSDGDLVGNNFCLTSHTDDNQLDPDVVIDGEYRYVCWTDNRNGNWDIYASIARYRQPTLAANPDYVHFVMDENGRLPDPQKVILTHSGIAGVNYSVSCDAEWLEFMPGSGTTIDTIELSIGDSTLSIGSYLATVTFVDVAAGDVSADISVRLDVMSLPQDTLSIAPAMVEVDQVGSTPVIGNINNEASSVTLSIQYVIDDLTIDSVRAGPTLPGDISVSTTIDGDGGLVTIEWQAVSVFGPGTYYLAELFFTAGSAARISAIDLAVNDTLCSTVMASGVALTPDVIGGEINISMSTEVGDEHSSGLPGGISLSQNWPNPFNMTTFIIYDLPRRARVTLEVFNVLGQRVRGLESTVKPAGSHAVRWDGKSDRGDAVPSGVYFYRLLAEDTPLVRKAILIK